jgi:hypothetical protein
MTLFLSYSSKDEAPVRALTADLARARLDVWLDQELRGGDPWWQDILRQIRECDVFLFALSANSLASKPCRSELAYARALGVPVLPVQIGAVENLRATPVADIQVVDYRERSASSGITLVAAVQDAMRHRRPLPDPLPPSPPVPFEYLLRLGEAMDSQRLSPDEQGQLLRQLRECLETEDDEGVREDARGLLRALRRRADVTHRSVMEIDALLDPALQRERVGTHHGGPGAADGGQRHEQPVGGPPPGPRPPDPQAPGVAPGWYPDPRGSGGQRFWDGNVWTEHVRSPEPPPPGAGNVLSIIAMVCGGIAILFFPIFIGVAGIVCAVIAKVRKENLSTVALGVSIGGTLLGVVLALALSSAYMY